MSVKITQFTSTNTNKQESSGHPALGLLTGAGAGAALGYYAIPKKMSAQELLKKYNGEKADKFIQRIKDFDSLPIEQQTKLRFIQSSLAHSEQEADFAQQAVKISCSQTGKTTVRKFLNTFFNMGDPGNFREAVGRSMKFQLGGIMGRMSGAALSPLGLLTGINYYLTKKALPSIAFWGLMGFTFVKTQVYNRLYPNKVLGAVLDQSGVTERATAARIASPMYSKAIPATVAQLVKARIDKAFHSKLYYIFAGMKHSEEMTEETASAIVKEAKETADRTLIRTIEENMQGVEKHMPKHGLRNAGIGALVGAAILGLIFSGHRKSSENKA